MSPTELDLPVLASAEQIRRREFVTTRRGYDPDQVRDYLEKIADQVGQMESLVREARLEAEAAVRAAAAPRTDPYEQLAARVGGLIRVADEEAERIRRDAREEAERILREVRADADRITIDAQSRAEEAKAEGERVLREARERADRAIAGLATRREDLVDQLAAMQGRLLSVAHDLEIAIEPRAKEPEAVVVDEPEPAFAGELRAEEPRDGSPRTMIDPRYEELWGGAGTIDLSMPEIPPLQLDWGDEDEGDAGEHGEG
jgi:DivIVA domain-containing protein